jgi:hypothetical protein
MSLLENSPVGAISKSVVQIMEQRAIENTGIPISKPKN